MEHDNLVVVRELKRLCESLGLQYEAQDWGIVNADGRRLSEFISYYEGNRGLSATQKFELGGLILASANEHLLNARESMPEALHSFLVQNRTAFEPQVEYWQSLQDAKEFPLSDWLKKFLVGPSRE
jgi:hypothetical protein